MNKELSKEDKAKIFQKLQEVTGQISGSSLSDLIGIDGAKLIECRHEIVISVMAHIYEQNDTGDTIGSKEICKKNYHIPVPSHSDYNDYLTGFFDFLENCMISSVEKMEKETNE